MIAQIHSTGTPDVVLNQVETSRKGLKFQCCAGSLGILTLALAREPARTSSLLSGTGGGRIWIRKRGCHLDIPPEHGYLRVSTVYILSGHLKILMVHVDHWVHDGPERTLHGFTKDECLRE